jgi:glycosyltransferase involved in cell wall biosynthesis
MKNPQVSIIMPVYNSSSYVGEAISSVLNQSHTDFEFLIIDDCSTDDCVSVIKKFSDHRIKFYQNEKNLGYIKSLNFLLSECKGEYIVRHDNDDFSSSDRILNQVNFLQKNDDHLICGSNCRVFGRNQAVSFLPQTDAECRVYMIFNSPFYHPSVCFSRKVFYHYNLFYNSELMPAEDYDMWMNISKFGKMANLQSIEFNLRTHDNNTSLLNSQRQKKILLVLREKYFNEILNLKIQENENNLLSGITYNSYFTNIEINQIENLFSKIITSNFENDILNKSDLDFWLLYFWTKVCFKNLRSKNLLTQLLIYFRSPIFKIISFLHLSKRLIIHKLKYN